MRPLTSDYRLQALSVPEIADEFEVVTKLISRTHSFNGRKLKPGPLLNALVLRFLRIPEPERSRYAGESVAILERILAETDEERATADQRCLKMRGELNGTVGVGVDPNTGKPLSRKTRRKGTA